MERNDSFWRELNEGDINFRDNLQFELKSEFVVDPSSPENTLTQEFYVFIPNSLQINKSSYSKERFWLDETNLIRYKTPRLTFEELVNIKNPLSPLARIEALKSYIYQPEVMKQMMDELKLFANIFRSALRHQVSSVMKEIEKKSSSEKLNLVQKQIDVLYFDIKKVRRTYYDIQNFLKFQSSDTLFKINVNHIDEFVSLSIDFFLTGLLDMLRKLDPLHFQKSDKQICEILNEERVYREKNNLVPKKIKGSEELNESILYRMGLLEKFTLEALMLNVYRSSWVDKHGNIAGALAAGTAMLLYMGLFVWKAADMAVKSTPFVIMAVVFYILKDRLKEGLKKLYYTQAFRWFPDVSTDIKSPSGTTIGKVTESFLFIKEEELPPGFLAIRNFDFHEELQSLKRHESIIRYKKEVTLYRNPEVEKSGRGELNTIFRLNIHHFLEKANNALQPVLVLDPITNKIVERQLPKVYHLNIIIKDTYLASDLKKVIDIKKFRVVVNKNGITRVEQL